jgi:aldose 1-epimerase
MHPFRTLLVTALCLVLSACAEDTTDHKTPLPEPAAGLDIQAERWGEADGRPVDLYTLTNSSGMQVTITNYGGIVVSIIVPDRNGNLADISLGFDNLEGYLAGHPYFGATVGRFANRIRNAKFELEGVEYKMPVNNDPHHLHGGVNGFDKKVWDVLPIKEPNSIGVSMSYYSPDGEEGYPGNLSVMTVFRLTEDNELRIDYTATTDKTTIVSLTNHTYFNLAGQGNGTILDQVVTFQADEFLERYEADNTPTGRILSVKGTPVDFTSPHTIGERIDQVGAGYGHCMVLKNSQDGSLGLAGTFYEPNSGRLMEIYTTKPGAQFYTGQSLDGSAIGKGGVAYGKHAAFCFETEYYPDTPNQPNFPSAVLKPGETYSHTTVHKFSVR